MSPLPVILLEQCLSTPAFARGLLRRATTRYGQKYQKGKKKEKRHVSAFDGVINLNDKQDVEVGQGLMCMIPA